MGPVLVRNYFHNFSYYMNGLTYWVTFRTVLSSWDSVILYLFFTMTCLMRGGRLELRLMSFPIPWIGNGVIVWTFQSFICRRSKSTLAHRWTTISHRRLHETHSQVSLKKETTYDDISQTLTPSSIIFAHHRTSRSNCRESQNILVWTGSFATHFLTASCKFNNRIRVRTQIKSVFLLWCSDINRNGLGSVSKRVSCSYPKFRIMTHRWR